MFIFNKRLHLIYYLSHYKTNHLHQYSLNFIIGNLSKSAKIQILIEIKKLYIIYLNLPGTFFFSIFFTFLFSHTVLQYRDIINKITLFVLLLLISIS